MLKVENNNSLARDEKTQAILNTNLSELEQYRFHRARALADKKLIENLHSDLNSMKEQLANMQALIKDVIAKRS